MVDREKILRFFRSSGDEELAAKCLDLAEGANKSGKYKVSEFLDPHGFNVAEIVASNYENIHLDGFGGFEYGERRKAAFVSGDFLGKPDFGVVALQLAWDKRYYDLSHRDVLGAFIGLGCEREALGDIVMVSEGAQLVCNRGLVDFLLTNFKTVGVATVEVKQIQLAELQQREEKVKEISATVADLRLDAVAAVGYGISRSRMTEEIKGQSVKVNWQVAKKASQIVAEGDVISFRGRGRVEIAEVRGLTKKGRIGVTLKRYM